MFTVKKKISELTMIVWVALWIVLFDNLSFFQHLLEVYPFAKNPLFVLSAGVILVLVFIVVFMLLAWRYTFKVVLVFFLILAAIENYFMMTYNVLIDGTMIENALQTDMAEVSDLMNWKSFAYLLVLGVLPAWFIYQVKIDHRPLLSSVKQRLKWIISIVVVIMAMMYPLSDYYTSFFREHRVIRFYTNPLHGMFALGRYMRKQYENRDIPLKRIGEDAHIEKGAERKRRIVVLVVGEAVRADHFGLNGYAKETTPYLAKASVINFPHVSSCGTTTAVSVPCMFSIYGKETYNSFKGKHTENVVDVLHRAGVDVIWRDNNSNSKGVADRVGYTSYKSEEHNTICIEGECRDEGMLVGLKELIEKSNKDILIVLHQMGNHGPAYYKRYPKAFAYFKPACQTNQLESCTQEEIANAYDNALRYTDYFLYKVIDLLKSVPSNTDRAMVYLSDHGESLGEGGFICMVFHTSWHLKPRPMYLWSCGSPKIFLSIRNA